MAVKSVWNMTVKNELVAVFCVMPFFPFFKDFIVGAHETSCLSLEVPSLSFKYI